MLDLPTAAGVTLGALTLGLFARRLVDTLDALLAEQRTTNELLREDLHRQNVNREAWRRLTGTGSALDALTLETDADPVDLDYRPRRGGEPA